MTCKRFLKDTKDLIFVIIPKVNSQFRKLRNNYFYICSLQKTSNQTNH